jgi:hypothetical protein
VNFDIEHIKFSIPLEHLPLREKQVKKQQQPDWMTYEIIQCMAQRDHFKSINDMKLTIRQRTLKFSGATLYNSLPRATRQSTSLSSFKIRAYQYFLDTYI